MTKSTNFVSLETRLMEALKGKGIKAFTLKDVVTLMGISLDSARGLTRRLRDKGKIIGVGTYTITPPRFVSLEDQLMEFLNRDGVSTFSEEDVEYYLDISRRSARGVLRRLVSKEKIWGVKHKGTYTVGPPPDGQKRFRVTVAVRDFTKEYESSADIDGYLTYEDFCRYTLAKYGTKVGIKDFLDAIRGTDNKRLSLIQGRRVFDKGYVDIAFTDVNFVEERPADCIKLLRDKGALTRDKEYYGIRYQDENSRILEMFCIRGQKGYWYGYRARSPNV